jgi:hypothetical protein
MKSLITAGLLSTLLVSSAFAQADADGKGKKKDGSNKNRAKMNKVELFKDADADSNGSLSLEEFTAKIMGAKQAEKSFKKFDENQDSLLSQGEFDKAIEEVYWFKVTRKTGQEWLAALDENKNGELSFEEYKSLQGGKPGEATFGRVDKDGNGGLSEEELDKHIQNVAKPKKADGEKKNKDKETDLK